MSLLLLKFHEDYVESPITRQGEGKIVLPAGEYAAVREEGGVFCVPFGGHDLKFYDYQEKQGLFTVTRLTPDIIKGKDGFDCL